MGYGAAPECVARPSDRGLEVFVFELAGERGVCRRRDAAQVLAVRSSGYLAGGLDVLGVGPLRVCRGVEPYQFVVGQAGCGVFGGNAGCGTLAVVH